MQLEDKTHWDLSGQALLKAAVHGVFAEQPHRIEEVLEGYAKPKEPEEDEAWDEEYQELWEELRVQDATNQQ